MAWAALGVCRRRWTAAVPPTLLVQIRFSPVFRPPVLIFSCLVHENKITLGCTRRPSGVVEMAAVVVATTAAASSLSPGGAGVACERKRRVGHGDGRGRGVGAGAVVVRRGAGAAAEGRGTAVQIR